MMLRQRFPPSDLRMGRGWACVSAWRYAEHLAQHKSDSEKQADLS
jgi:hypothetical protein